jgi:cytochrome c5
MSRRSISLVALFATLSLGACAPAPPPQSGGGQAAEDSARAALLLAAASAALPPPGVVPAMLPSPGSDAAKLIAKYCMGCHELAPPSSHSTTDWPGVMRRMWIRMERVDSAFGIPVPTPAERVIMLRYMLDNALLVASSALPPGPGSELFSATCSRCHALPDPRQHSPADWPAVVIRMRQRMETMLRQSPTQGEVQQLILYLERASSSRG